MVNKKGKFRVRARSGSMQKHWVRSGLVWITDPCPWPGSEKRPHAAHMCAAIFLFWQPYLAGPEAIHINVCWARGPSSYIQLWHCHSHSYLLKIIIIKNPNSHRMLQKSLNKYAFLQPLLLGKLACAATLFFLEPWWLASPVWHVTFHSSISRPGQTIETRFV